MTRRPLTARIAPLTLATALLAGPAALAQSVHAQSVPAQQGASPFLTAPPPGAMRASKIRGVGVVGQDHVRVGKIEDLLVTEDGRVRAVVIGVGGFLGLGEKKVAVPFDTLAWNTGVSPRESPPSFTTPERAPSEAEARTAGPETMPGATSRNEVLSAVQDKHSGAVTEATGSVEAARQPRGPATVLVVGKSGGPIEAELRMTKAELEAAPAFDDEARPAR
ncbi:PRC-barrel domain protein [Methylobacterium sp. 4-46]|uniref:PRC-barrel domain-containing protein n=1 Tax=unclassified Methylobacterium TaxID=2615210 RepID=UPI000165C5E4|nr:MULTISPECIES: PRC-barrel domain-containing protein [Methylobacterium]ACA16141.1 PRC-barrel domain protein [Methylobacterium sp. 4-46]WFT81850.1 PRC-barrel domain-containing protein [Methylobacterium nodulans]